MTTPSDSAMTAERLLQRLLEVWDNGDLSDDRLSLDECKAAFDHITKLAADLARVEGERDNLRSIKASYERDIEQRARYASEQIDKLDAAEAKSARLAEALKVPEVWSQTERDGMAAAFDKADGKRGHYETLFAVAAWLLRHRQSIALTLPEPSHEP